MKHLLNVWAWALAHWDVVLSLLGLLAYAWLNAANARTAIEKRAGSKLLAIIDRIAVLTMKGAANRASAPVLGKSIADDLRAQLGTVRDEPLAGTGEGVQINSDGTPPIRRETQAPPPPSEPGFVERSILLVIAVASALALVALLAGCPMPAPDNCTPFATRCSPSGIPETCSQSQRWSHAPPASPCSSRGPVVCCRTRSPWGNELHACAPQSACLPETAADAGAEVSDAR